MSAEPVLRYSASPSAIGERLGEEVAILHVETGTYFGLKGVGIDVWNLLDRSRTLDEIVQHITSEYEVDPLRCQADIRDLLARLQEACLVKAEGDAHA